MTAPQPLPAGTPLPHRKIIRQWLLPLAERSTGRALVLVLLDSVLWLAAIAGTVLFASVWAKLACGLAAGFVTGRLFILGHDACHQSLTPHRTLNKWLGRLCFLPSLTPYSLWEVGHNVVHHGYTNLKGFDFVWAPLTREEYAARPARERLAYRVYRSGWAPGLYYGVEMWWKRMFFPNGTHMPTRRAVFLWDNLLVTAFGAAWVGGLWAAAVAARQHPWTVVACGALLPFVFWCSMIGFVVYVHHTHTAIRWHADRGGWSAAQPFVSTTVHLTFPLGIGGAMHHIMEHTAHHVDMSIPLYRLKEAQALLERTLPGRIVVQHFSWRWYFDTARRCKLYDTERQCWLGFDGRTTSEAAAG